MKRIDLADDLTHKVWDHGTNEVTLYATNAEYMYMTGLFIDSAEGWVCIGARRPDNNSEVNMYISVAAARDLHERLTAALAEADSQ